MRASFFGYVSRRLPRYFDRPGEKPTFKGSEAQESTRSFLQTINGSWFFEWDCFELSTKLTSVASSSAGLFSARRPIEHESWRIHFGNGLFLLSAKGLTRPGPGSARLDHDLR